MADRSLRCSAQARAQGYRPAGTAASAPTFVLVEAPLPWPSDVAEHPLLVPLAPLLKAHGARLQALVPDDAPDVAVDDGAGSVAVAVRADSGRDAPADAARTAPPLDQLRVIVYHQPRPDASTDEDDPDHQVHPYVRHERLVLADRLEAVVAELLEDVAGAGDTGSSPGGVGDVLVCTHGSRDVCCGSDGMNLYRDLKALALPGVRVWRTSHTGGHRFAPTAVTFPDGRAWAWLDVELLAGIVTRSAAADVAARHDRGSAALPDPFAQAADAAVLGVEGWAWLDHPRTAEVVPVDGDGHRVVTLTAPAASYRAEVVVKRVVPVPDCGRPLDQARKSSPEVEVVALVRQGTPGTQGTQARRT